MSEPALMNPRANPHSEPARAANLHGLTVRFAQLGFLTQIEIYHVLIPVLKNVKTTSVTTHIA